MFSCPLLFVQVLPSFHIFFFNETSQALPQDSLAGGKSSSSGYSPIQALKTQNVAILDVIPLSYPTRIYLIYTCILYDLCNLIIYLNHLLGFILRVREMLFETKGYSCFMTFHSLRIPTCWVVPSLKAPGHRWPSAKQVMQSFGFWLSCLLCVCTNRPHPIQDSGAEHLEGVQGHYCQEGVFESTVFLEQTCSWWVVHKTPPKHTLTNTLFENQRQVLKTHHKKGTNRYKSFQGWADFVPLKSCLEFMAIRGSEHLHKPRIDSCQRWTRFLQRPVAKHKVQ